MKTNTQTNYGRELIHQTHRGPRRWRSELIPNLRVVGLAIALLAGAWTGRGQELARPEGVIDAGDYYTLADGSKVALLQASGEIAVKRDRNLRSEAVLQLVGADARDLSERLLTTVDLGESHVVDLLRVDDAADAISRLSGIAEVVSAMPVFVDPRSRHRLAATDEIIVQLEKEGDLAAAVAELGTEGLEPADAPGPAPAGQVLLKFAKGVSGNALTEANRLAAMPGVAWAEPNFIVEIELCSIPNDELFNRQQGLYNEGQNQALAGADIDAPGAWDITTGNDSIVIAILDTGVDTAHLDFEGKIFNNPNELAYGRSGNGVDDDANGYVDDWRGWDFYSWDNNPNPGTSAGAAHGTSCAGIAAAKGNNEQRGVAGVAYGCKILAVKVSANDGTGLPSTYRLGQAIRYAADYADILSISWTWAEHDAINSAIDYAATSGRGGKGCPVLCASGNDGGQWWIDRVDVNVQPGTYKFGFYVQRAAYSNSAKAAIDNVSLLDGTSEYWYEDDVLPRETFETDPFTRGWTVAHGGDATLDWARWQGQDLPGPLHGTPSTWCARTPVDVTYPTGGWLELRSPSIYLTGSHVLRVARWYCFDPPNLFQVRLLDSQGNVLETLANLMDARYLGELRVVRYPATHSTSIAIGAATDMDRYADYSCYFKSLLEPNTCGLFCVGPSNGGVNEITTTDISGPGGRNNPGDYRMHFGGTSSAAPCVAGVAGLVLSRNANLTLQEAKDSLSAGCEQIGEDPYDPVTHKALHYGYGRVNANNSVRYHTPADTVAPTVASVVTKTGRMLEITFSEKMGVGVTTPAKYALSGTGRGTLAANPTSVAWVSGNKYLLEWTAGEMVSGTGNLTLMVSAAVKDVAGNLVGFPNYGVANGSRMIYAENAALRRSPDSSYPIAPFESERQGVFSGGTLYVYYAGLGGIIDNDGTPDAVYLSERCILCSTTYTTVSSVLPNLTPGVNHTVRLYFYNNGYSQYPGDVLFSVWINGVLKLSSLDLVAAAGGPNIGFWRQFANIQPNNGQILIELRPTRAWNRTWNAYYYGATVSGVKVTAN